MSIKAINVRNQFRGKVKEIIDGPVVSEVDIETPAGIVTSVITTRSVRDLGLAPGVEVVALVKATEVSIAKLFVAGIIPGLLTAGMLMLTVVLMTLRDPEHAPPGERHTWPQRWRALRGIWGVVVLVIVVLGGIYGGFFTATEGAGFGAAGAFLFALLRGRLTWAVLFQVQDPEVARVLVKAGYLLIIFLPTSLYHFLAEISERPGERRWVYASYGIAAVLGIFDVATDLFVDGHHLERERARHAGRAGQDGDAAPGRARPWYVDRDRVRGGRVQERRGPSACSAKVLDAALALEVLGDAAHRVAHLEAHPPADAGVHLVEDERRNAVEPREDRLEREHHARQLAARRHA